VISTVYGCIMFVFFDGISVFSCQCCMILYTQLLMLWFLLFCGSDRNGHFASLCRALELETGELHLELHQSHTQLVLQEDMVNLLNCTTRHTSSNRGRQVSDNVAEQQFLSPFCICLAGRKKYFVDDWFVGISQ